ncbi:MAG: TfoX/Sxy family protein [Actinomycetota bacterium]
MSTLDDDFVQFVFDQIGDRLGCSAKRMFGGIGLYAGGPMFGIVYDGALYLKVDDTTRGLFEERAMGPFRPREGQTLTSYYEVPADVLDDRGELSTWCERALHAASE